MQQHTYRPKTIFRRIWLVDSAVQLSIIGIVFKGLIITLVALVAIQRVISTYGERFYSSSDGGFLMDVLFLACSLGGTFCVGLYISNKIAGPIYSLQKHIDSVVDNKNRELLQFRKGDHYHELAAKYNRLISHINKLEDELSKRKTGSFNY